MAIIDYNHHSRTVHTAQPAIIDYNHHSRTVRTVQMAIIATRNRIKICSPSVIFIIIIVNLVCLNRPDGHITMLLPYLTDHWPTTYFSFAVSALNHLLSVYHYIRS